jgi:hypothetical protein
MVVRFMKCPGVRKRGWKRCECPIVISGTLQKKFRRHSTGLWEWDYARALAAQIEARGTWSDMPAPLPAIPSAPSSDLKRIPIPEATEHFLSELRESAAFATHKKCRLLMARFERFSNGTRLRHHRTMGATGRAPVPLNLAGQPSDRSASHGNAEALLRILRQQ